MRYVRIPESVVMRDLVTEDSGARVSFAQALRLVLATMTGELDALTIIDIARAVERADVGSVVEVSDDHWSAISAKFRRPSMLAPAYVLAAERHIRAWLDAPSERTDAEVSSASPPS